MSTVYFLAIVSAASIAVGAVWIGCVIAFVDHRAGAGAAASLLIFPGISAIGLGLILAVLNGIVAVSL